MKKVILLLTAPFLLIDACSSARLAKKEIAQENIILNDEPASPPLFSNNKVIVVRQLSNGDFEMSTNPICRGEAYRKPTIIMKGIPD